MAYETFYLRASGNGSAPKTVGGAYDAADFNTAGNWTASDAEDDNLIGPGDTVIVLDDDGPIQTQLTIQQSGLSGKPITIQGENGGATLTVTAGDGRGIFAWGKSYITVSGLTITGCTNMGIFVGGTSGTGNGWVITDNTLASNGGEGVRLGASGYVVAGLLVADNLVSYNGDNGIWVGYGGTGTIRNNIVHHNCANASAFTNAGIKIWDANVTDVIIERNVCYENGPSTPGANQGWGIWVDNTGGGHTVRFNHVYANGAGGIYSEKNTVADTICYNVIHDEQATTEAYCGAGIRVSDAVANQLVYNNTIYNCKVGVAVFGTWPLTASSCEDNAVRNNIVSACTTALVAWAGGENDGTYGSGNVYTYNCLGPQANDFVDWGGGTFKDTYDAWETAYGGTTNSVEADPLFVSTSDFHLQAGSPCINAGVDVGLTTDFDGRPVERTPDVGAYERHVGWIDPTVKP